MKETILNADNLPCQAITCELRNSRQSNEQLSLFVDCDYRNKRYGQIYCMNRTKNSISKPSLKLLKSPCTAYIFQGASTMLTHCKTFAARNDIKNLPWDIVDLKDFFKAQRALGDKRFTLCDIAQEYGISYVEKYNGIDRVKCIEELYNKISPTTEYDSWLNPLDSPEDIDEIKLNLKARKQSRQPYKLSYGGFIECFATKKEIKNYYGNILKQYQDIPVTLDDVNLAAASALFGAGIISINKNGRNVCFYKDQQPISYTKAIADIGHTPEENLKRRQISNFTTAARESIYSQICEFKKYHPPPPGINHVDHYNLFFADILWEWLSSVPVKISSTTIRETDGRKRFLSDEVEVSWQKFHHTKATLQWLPAQENMKKQPKRRDWTHFY